MSAAIVVRKQAASFCTGRVDGVPVASVQLRSTGLLMYDIYTSNCSTSGVFACFCAAEFVLARLRPSSGFPGFSRKVPSRMLAVEPDSCAIEIIGDSSRTPPRAPLRF